MSNRGRENQSPSSKCEGTTCGLRKNKAPVGFSLRATKLSWKRTPTQVDERRVSRNNRTWSQTRRWGTSTQTSCIGSRPGVAASNSMLLDRLQFLAGLEANSLAGRDADFGARARIASDAGLARADVEHTKAAKLNAVAAFEGLLHAGKDRLNSHFSLGFRDPSLFHHVVDDIQLDQRSRPPPVAIFIIIHSLATLSSDKPRIKGVQDHLRSSLESQACNLA